MQFFFLNVEGEDNGEQQLSIRWMLIVCVTYFGSLHWQYHTSTAARQPRYNFCTWQIQVWHVIHHCTRTNFERYQVGTKDYRITYRNDGEATLDWWRGNSRLITRLFYRYSDAAYTSTGDHKTTSGYVFLVNGEPLIGLQKGNRPSG